MELQRSLRLLLASSRVRALSRLIRYQNEPRRTLHTVVSVHKHNSKGMKEIAQRYCGYSSSTLKSTATVAAASVETKRKRASRVKKEAVNDDKQSVTKRVSTSSERELQDDTTMCTSEVASEKPKKRTRRMKEVPNSEVVPKTAADKPKRKTRKTKLGSDAEVMSTAAVVDKLKRRTRKAKAASSAEEVLAEDRTAEEETPKRRTQRKKESDKEEEAELPEPSFPFEGATLPDTDHESKSVEYSSADDEFGVQPKHSSIERIHTAHGRFYQISSPKGVICFPSVTTILKRTMPLANFFRLHNWRKSMIKKHGEKGFETISREVKQLGTNFHQDLEARLVSSSTPKSEDSDTTEGELPPEVSSQEGDVHGTSLTAALPFNIKSSSGYMHSVEHVLKEITDVRALEGTVAHRELGYTGTFDCVAKYRGELCVIDWKTSGKPRPTLSDCYEYPLQAVAYAGAINEDPHYPFKVHSALIVIVYPSGEPAHAHLLSHQDCLTYWAKWLQRLQDYQTQSAGDMSNVYIQI